MPRPRTGWAEKFAISATTAMPWRALLGRGLGAQADDGAVAPRLAAARVQHDDLRAAASSAGATSSQPVACRSVTT
jgi:hypothetical protein